MIRNSVMKAMWFSVVFGFTESDNTTQIKKLDTGSKTPVEYKRAISDSTDSQSTGSEVSRTDKKIRIGNISIPSRTRRPARRSDPKKSVSNKTDISNRHGIPETATPMRTTAGALIAASS